MARTGDGGPAPPTEASLGVVAPRSEGEAVRRRLLEAGRLRTDLGIVREADRLIFPVDGEVDGLETVEAEFPVREVGPRDYRELLDLPDDLEARLPSSFDRIGDVVVFKLPDELAPYKGMVAEALQEFTSARTVALDRGVQGPHRVRDLDIVVGDDTATVHREHGVVLHVDPARAYFSPRLATERRRVADRVEPGEVVVDAFAGVGPFSLVVARHADPDRVVAIERNPEAVELLEANVEANRAGGVVEVRSGDARGILPDLAADRVVMNLPHDAVDYLDEAREALAGTGSIHLYAVVADDDVPDRRRELEAAGLDVRTVRRVHGYSPASAMVVFDCREAGP